MTPLLSWRNKQDKEKTSEERQTISGVNPLLCILFSILRVKAIGMTVLRPVPCIYVYKLTCMSLTSLVPIALPVDSIYICFSPFFVVLSDPMNTRIYS